MSIQPNKITELRLDFIKTWVTFLLAIIAGETTLLSTSFVTTQYAKIFLFCSIILFLFACISSLGVSESIINKYNKPNSDNFFVKFSYKISPKTELTEWVLTYLSSLFIALGFVSLVLVFVFKFLNY